MTTDAELLKRLKARNDLNKTGSHRRLLNAVVRGMLESSRSVDRFSLWLLAISGGAAGLIIANVSLVRDSEVDIRVPGALLAVSAAFGFLARFNAFRLELLLNRFGDSPEVESIHDDHAASADEIAGSANSFGIVVDTEIDYERLIEDLANLFPLPVRWFVKRKLQKSLLDPQFANRVAAEAVWLQGLFTSLQSLFFALAFIASTWIAVV